MSIPRSLSLYRYPSPSPRIPSGWRHCARWLTILDMREDQVKAARDSLSRCLENENFLDRFYELFMGASSDVAEKFAKTDFEKQKQVLKDSLFLMMVTAGTDKGFGHDQLQKLGKRHSRNELDIKPEHYEIWVDTLMQTVKECDPSYSEALDASWRSALTPGIEFLKSKY